jgi:hypothetical protein
VKSVLFKVSWLVLVFSLILASSVRVLGQVDNGNSASVITDTGWRLVIDGAVSTPLNLSLPDMAAMPQASWTGPLICESAVIYDGVWTGVQVETLLQQAGIDPAATDLEFHALDGYQVNVSVVAAIAYGMIIAYELNGTPLSQSLRLVCPGAQGPYWIAWITEIDVTMSYNFNIGPPPVPISVVVTPQGTESSAPSSNSQPTPTSTPYPVTPSLTPQPSQTPDANVTTPPASPSLSTAPTPISTTQPSAPVPSDNESSSSLPTVAPSVAPSSSSSTSAGKSSTDIYVIVPVIIIIVIAMAAYLFTRLGKKPDA